jgi:hypothetical protein
MPRSEAVGGALGGGSKKAKYREALRNSARTGRIFQNGQERISKKLFHFIQK